MGRRVVKFWNFITRARSPRVDSGSILILLPSCMQNGQCAENVRESIENCSRCGKCKVKDIAELAEKYKCRGAVATGGRLALKLAREDAVEAVIAIACEKELQEGLKGIFPKPALGIINIRRNGPCKDTDVDVQLVENAIKSLVDEEGGEPAGD